MTLEVALTVDVEFSIGGAFADPRREPIGLPYVECVVEGRAAGLDFILDTLERHRLRGVFFVEALNTLYFGDAPMGAIARRIHARGHEVALHVHPCWSVFAHADWPRRVASATPTDSFAALDDAEIERLIGIGVEAIARWGVPRPVAFRAGNLSVDARIYPALARRGIALASNLGIGVHMPADATLRLAGGRHVLGGVTEVPVSSYVDARLPGRERWKTFTVIGTGAWEARQWLDDAAARNAGPVVVLTHPTEFVHGEPGREPLHVNRVATRRLQSLCAHLDRHRERFETVTFAERAQAWRAATPTPDPRWTVSPLARVARVLENRAAGAFRAA